jgi:excisionase family DNA binding protein
MNKLTSPVLTIDETAHYLKLPVSKVYELVRAKDFPSVKLGKHWRIFQDRLDQWLICQLEEKEDNV